MENLIDKLNDELKIAMKYNCDMYAEEVIRTVLDFSCSTRNYNYKPTNQILYDALVKYNKFKGLYKNAKS